MHGHDLGLPAGQAEHGVHGVVRDHWEYDLSQKINTTFTDEPIMSEQHSQLMAWFILMLREY